VAGSDERIWIVQGQLDAISFGDGTTWTAAQVQDNIALHDTVPGGLRRIGLDPDLTSYDARPQDELIEIPDFFSDVNATLVRYERTDGHDIVSSYDFSPSEANNVEMLDVASTEIDVWLLPFGNALVYAWDAVDLLIRFGSDDNALRLRGVAEPDDISNLQSVTFSDDVTLTIAQLLAQAALAEATGQRNCEDRFVLTRGTDTGDFAITQSDDGGAAPLPVPIGVDLPPFGVQVALVDVLASELTPEIRAGEMILHIAARAVEGSDAATLWLGEAGAGFNAPDLFVVLDDGTVLEMQDLTALVAYPEATAGDDVLLVRAGADDDRFPDDLMNPVGPGGPDLPEGPEGPNAIRVEGLQGDDIIDAKNEVATFVYTRGDGNDLIYAAESSFNGDFAQNVMRNTLELIGIAPEAVGLFAADADLLVRIDETAPGAGDGGTIRFVDGYTLYETIGDGVVQSASRLGAITFDDGTIWDQQTIEAAAQYDRGTEGDDTVFAEGPGVYEMRGGDDWVAFNGHGYTYIYTNGDGDDIIRDSGGNSFGNTRANVLQLPDFLPDFLLGDVGFRRDRDDLVVDFIADPARGIEAGCVTMRDAFAGEAARFADTIVHSDGSETQLLDIIAAIVNSQGSDGDDRITGSDRADILMGGLGNDVMIGGDGDDTYVYTRGDGHDDLLERGVFDTRDQSDTLDLRGIAQSDVTPVLTPLGVRFDIAESTRVRVMQDRCWCTACSPGAPITWSPKIRVWALSVSSSTTDPSSLWGRWPQRF